jgi:NADPH:quinone reductase-like Zn-dependent oxidoreductase
VRAIYAEHGQLVQKDVPEPDAGPGQLLVAVKAAGLNAADTLMRAGSHIAGATVRPPTQVAPASMPLGAEAAGEVVAVGEGVEEFSIGDRVMGICSGAFAPLAVINAAMVMRVPDQLEWTEAAAVPVVFSTAHDALVRAARLTAGDHVLVTAASSGVGVAALQLARHLGAGVVAASSRSPEKLDELRAAGVPFDEGLITGAPDLVERGLQATDDHGFDVVVDCVGAAAVHENIGVAALGGRIVSVGRMSGHMAEIDLDELARKRLSLVGVTFRTRPPSEIADASRQASADVVRALADGRLRVVLDRVFPFEDVVAAQEWMRAGRRIGKVVLEFG